VIALDEVDTAVEKAIGTGDPGPLRVLGYGEITLVVGWPPEQPEYAVKRLPPFPDADCLAEYRSLLAEYADILLERGVNVLPTEVRARECANGELHAYLVQPFVEPERVLDLVLRDAAAAEGERLIGEVVDAVVSAVDPVVGLDAQAANWEVDDDGRLACFDVSTPMLRQSDGTQRLDLEPFLSIYPYALRSILRRVARDVMATYHDPRNVLLDFASNLIKEELQRWLPPALEATNEAVTPPLEEDEVRRYFARDRRLWLLMQRLRRLDRAWQRHVRRRRYSLLLPPPYRYGPPSTWKGHPA
jgi:hypothetical protein